MKEKKNKRKKEKEVLKLENMLSYVMFEDFSEQYSDKRVSL